MDAFIERAFREEQERLKSLRFLRPDAEMESLGPAAQQWIRDRIDEHIGALLANAANAPLFGGNPIPTMEFVLALHRDGLVFSQAMQSHALDPLSPMLEAWSSCVRYCDVGISSSEDFRRCAHQLSVTTQETTRTFSELPNPPLWNLVRQHFQWRVQKRDAPNHPSPFAPLLALWERGVWPAICAPNLFLVLIPKLREGRPKLFSSSKPVPSELVVMDDATAELRSFHWLSTTGLTATPVPLRLFSQTNKVRGAEGPLPPPELPRSY